MNSSNQLPHQSFGRHFRVAPAMDRESLDEVFFIRHDVYARELGYEPVRADQRETDRYDRHAVHCIVRTHGEPVRPVGCTRLVLTNPAAPSSPLPFEAVCKDTLDRSIIDPAALPRHQMAEVSRLAVMGEFRRRKGERGHPISVSSQDSGGRPAARFPNIPCALYLSAVAMAQRHGVEYLFTLTEPRLARHFARLGVHVQAIGAPVEHRGLRVPSMMRVSQVYNSLRSIVRPIWHEVQAQIETAYLLQAAAASAAETRVPVSV
jgi:N-acyl amino acid synthase of PEP-CTERM/exosortase system